MKLEFGILKLEFGILNLEFYPVSELGLSTMRYRRFEDLPVWNTAIELALATVTDRSKRSDQAAREREEFLKELLEIRNKHVAQRN